MQLYKRQKEGNDSLVLFFNGWGMDEKCISHISSDDMDVMVFFDYRGDISLPSIEIEKYKNIYVVAWSMGVWVANQLISDLPCKVDRKVALCGSPFPVHDDYGIPEKVFDLTVKGLERAGTEKFFRRMLVGLDGTSFQKPERELTEQIEELNNLKIKSLTLESKDVEWDRVVVGMNDKIFPTSNVIRYWEEKLPVVKSDSPHYPFNEYNCWEKILNI